MKFALVGCGNVAHRYARTFPSEPRLELAGATDVVPGRATEFVAEYGGKAYESLEQLLADDEVEAVVNLAVPEAHAPVTAACLEAGKHVHSEKPLALRYEEAKELVELAESRGLRLSCSPGTLMGEAQQTAWKLLREGTIGTVRTVYAEANWGRLESWHPAPGPLYAVGPVVDVGVYPLTVLTGMFGPARRVLAYGTVLEPDRVTLDGVRFRLETPDFVVAVLELAGGLVIRLTASFYVPPSKQRGLEFHGDLGSLYLATWAEFDSRLELALGEQEYAPVSLLREPFPGIGWSRILIDLADAIAEGRRPRAGGQQAAHIVEILSAIEESRTSGGQVAIHSGFEQPPPMEWAR